ncbi:DUF1439 domain-containing protein [Ferrimonas pelagia]|uniref:DUF1439 domain-containing protein n=1 Tax=Ferrimonas pelagia TaxID=1177826 RepID=A0ABP9FFL3_9GAMM
MKKSVWVGLAALLLGGCATSYSVSESELEGHLNRQLRSEQKIEGSGLLGAELTFSDIQVEIGQETDRVSVAAHSRIKVNTPLIPLRAGLELQFKATPWYDNTDHSIYLRDLELANIEASPKELEQMLLPLSREAMQWVQLYLENQPIYKLEEQGWQQDILRKFGKEIRIRPGKLEFVLEP